MKKLVLGIVASCAITFSAHPESASKGKEHLGRHEEPAVVVPESAPTVTLLMAGLISLGAVAFFTRRNHPASVTGPRV